MNCTEPHAEGAVLNVKLTPQASKAQIRAIEAGRLRVAVTAVPERGRANRALVELVCKSLRLRKSQVELLSGHTAREKRLLVRAVSPDSLEQRLAEFLAQSL